MTQLEDFCKKHNITISSKHLGLVKDPWDKKSDRVMDSWDVELQYKGKKLQTPFYSGIGNRKLPINIQEKTKAGYWVGYPINYWIKNDLELAQKNLSKPVPPTVADVLSALLGSASALEETFEEWCQSFGYDEDSRTAERTYLACQQETIKVKQLLGKLFDKAREQEH